MQSAVHDAVVQDPHRITTFPRHDYNQLQPSRLQYFSSLMNEGYPQSVKTKKLSTIYSPNLLMEGASQWSNQAYPALETLSHQRSTINTTGISDPSRLASEVSFMCCTCHTVNHLQQQNYLLTTSTDTQQLVPHSTLADITDQRQQPFAPHTLSPSIPNPMERKLSASFFDGSESTTSSEIRGYSDSIPSLGEDNGVATPDSSGGIPPSSPIKNPFKCYFPTCTRRFARLSDVHRHIQTHDNVNTRVFNLKCNICHKRKQYTRMDSFYRHVRNCKLKHSITNSK
ncbi:hypothetical protein BJV82DRAFT_607273 [Fennellomyces sp. T-0311]|nr:hypothetical protein BJV82DRAFT_607273 [Fennellomyces sp. T-0311]